MVCPRCIMAVKDILDKLSIAYIDVKLGEVILTQSKETLDMQSLRDELEAIGFELIEDHQIRIVEDIKRLIIDVIRNPEQHSNPYNFSHYIADQIGKDYHSLSKLFSEKESITIEKFIILQRIEYVKELLIYDEYNLSEIADKLGYSSISHLSNQFKQITGFSPSQFRKLQDKERKTLDDI